jgi:hypothetical protein
MLLQKEQKRLLSQKWTKKRTEVKKIFNNRFSDRESRTIKKNTSLLDHCFWCMRRNEEKNGVNQKKICFHTLNATDFGCTVENLSNASI